MDRIAVRCQWCGKTDCVRRVEHAVLNAQRETTWRERAVVSAALDPDAEVRRGR